MDAMNCNIMELLFALDLDEIIQKIFLNLDPLSLKNCKCVNREWFHFIQKRLWNSKSAREKLQNRLISQWKFSEPFVTEYGQDMMVVNFLTCDDEIVLCGYTRGEARAYDLETGELRFLLACNTAGSWADEGVQLDLGRTVIGSLTDNGFVSIWDKSDGRKLYQRNYQNIFVIKVTDDSVLTGCVDGRLVMLESIEGVWGMTREMSENKEGIIDIDTDGKWAATGTRQSILLWDLEEHKMVENIKEVKTMVWML